MNSWSDHGRELTLALACMATATLFALIEPNYGTMANAQTVLRNSYELLVISLAMTLLMAMGAVDISIGIAMGFCALFVGFGLFAGLPLILVILIGPAVGAVIGLGVAGVVVGGQIPPIVGTLGIMGVLRMAIYLILGGQWMSGVPGNLTDLLASKILGLPVTVWGIAALYLAVWTLLRRTSFGLHILAVGNSERKARLSGLPVVRIRVLTHILSGMLSGAAAIIFIATYRNVTMTVGTAIGLEAIAAVILGGTAITGGKCSIIGTVLGVLLLRIIQNGLLMMGVPSLWQTVVTGGLLLAVLIIEFGAGRLTHLVKARSPA
ncbi:putative autoinducer 2 import system permease protein [Marinibacterium anthonyi]|nr:putative autoinducer 2 import system permease protein [Marinibacterium anthonyi]